MSKLLCAEENSCSLSVGKVGFSRIKLKSKSCFARRGARPKALAHVLMTSKQSSIKSISLTITDLANSHARQ